MLSYCPEVGKERSMAKRILMAFVWFLVLYFGACMLTGGIAGAAAGSRERDPKNASAVGAKAGGEAVRPLAGYFLIGALVIGGGGSLAGVMPGTRSR
jgi:hypothetical protein